MLYPGKCLCIIGLWATLDLLQVCKNALRTLAIKYFKNLKIFHLPTFTAATIHSPNHTHFSVQRLTMIVYTRTLTSTGGVAASRPHRWSARSNLSAHWGCGGHLEMVNRKLTLVGVHVRLHTIEEGRRHGGVLTYWASRVHGARTLYCYNIIITRINRQPFVTFLFNIYNTQTINTSYSSSSQ